VNEKDDSTGEEKGAPEPDEIRRLWAAADALRAKLDTVVTQLERERDAFRDELRTIQRIAKPGDAIALSLDTRWTAHWMASSARDEYKRTFYVKYRNSNSSTDRRAITVRLALYLRALLRVDKEDLGGRWECEGCGSTEGVNRIVMALTGRPDPGPCCTVARDEWTLHVMPLWEAVGPERYQVAAGVRWVPGEGVDERGWRYRGRWVRREEPQT
jgi:hypothetical protein